MISASEKRIVGICYVVIAFFALTLLTCALFPIYPDEVSTRQIFSRLVFDFPLRSGAFPTCIGSFHQPYPLVWLIPAMFEWLLHGSYGNFFILRAVGISISIGFALLLFILIRRITFSSNQFFLNHKNIIALAIVISFISLGVYPIFSILNRNEQLILVAVLISLFISNVIFEKALGTSKLICFYFCFLLLMSFAFYAHPKSLYLLPFFTIIFTKFFRGFEGYICRVISLFIFLLIIVSSYYCWLAFFQCPEVPLLSTFIKTQNINPSLLFTSPSEFFILLKKSIFDLSGYYSSFSFQQNFEVNYLPSFHDFIGLQIINNLIKISVSIVIFSPLVLFFLLRNEWGRNNFCSFNLVLFCLYLSGILSAILRVEKHWYDAGYIYSISLIVLVWLASVNQKLLDKISYKKTIFFSVIILSIISQLTFNIHFLPRFIRGFSGPGVSLVNLARSPSYYDAINLITKCNIDIPTSNQIIVDDLTYQYVYKSKNPISLTYVLLTGDSHKSNKFIANANSSGMLLSCNSMSYFAPDLYKSKALKSGNLCCVSGRNLKFICENGACN